MSAKMVFANVVYLGAVLVVLCALTSRVYADNDLFLGSTAAKLPSASDAATQAQSGQARGMLQASAEALLSSQIAGRVIELPYKVGDAFAKGAVLVRLDCDFYQAQQAASEAAAAAEAAQLESNRQLAKLHSIGALEVQLAEAKWRKAEAEVQVNRTLTDRCRIVAPFAGRVVETKIHNHESVNQGTELLTIVDRVLPEIRLIVPSRWLGWLRPGTKFTFRVDETGSTVPAAVTAVGARVDAVSQTVQVRAQFTSNVDNLLSGMSGTATFTPAGR